MQKLLAVSLAVIALPLAACGGDDDSDSGSSSAKDEFIAKGDAICEDINAKISEINQKLSEIGGKGSAAKQFEASEPLMRESVEIQEEAIADFRALELPEDDRDIVQGYLDKADEQRDVLEEVADALAAKDKEAVEEASDGLGPIGEQRRQLAREYGFKKCGGG